MGEKRYAKNPLLYIQQPTISTPIAPMQHNYVTPKKGATSLKNSNEIEKGSTSRGPFSNKNTQFLHAKETTETTMTENRDDFSSEESEAIESSDTDEEEPDISGNTSRQRFKDMSNLEKVTYFSTMSSHVPRMKCEVKTEEKSYKGFIVDHKEGTVFMRVGRRITPVEISLESISTIRLLGF